MFSREPGRSGQAARAQQVMLGAILALTMARALALILSLLSRGQSRSDSRAA
jgi:hypothetical protein